MRVGDAVDRVLALSEHGPVRFGAIDVLIAAYEKCAPDFIGFGEPAARQMSGEAIADVHAALLLALEALDEARMMFPSGPVRLAPEQPAN